MMVPINHDLIPKYRPRKVFATRDFPVALKQGTSFKNQIPIYKSNYESDEEPIESSERVEPCDHDEAIEFGEPKDQRSFDFISEYKSQKAFATRDFSGVLNLKPNYISNDEPEEDPIESPERVEPCDHDSAKEFGEPMDKINHQGLKRSRIDEDETYVLRLPAKHQKNEDFFSYNISLLTGLSDSDYDAYDDLDNWV